LLIGSVWILIQLRYLLLFANRPGCNCLPKLPVPALFLILCSLGRCTAAAHDAISNHRLECCICYIGGSFTIPKLAKCCFLSSFISSVSKHVIPTFSQIVFCLSNGTCFLTIFSNLPCMCCFSSMPG